MGLIKGHTFEDGDTVTAAKLNNLVDLGEIEALSVTNAMLQSSSVTADKLAPDAVKGSSIGTNTVHHHSFVNSVGDTRGSMLQSGTSGVFQELAPHATAGLPLKSGGPNASLVYAALDNVGVGAELISGHDEDTAPAKDDFVLASDTSEGANKKVLVSNLWKSVNGLSEVTDVTLDDTDELAILAAGTTPKKINIASVRAAIAADSGLPSGAVNFYNADSDVISALTIDWASMKTVTFTHGLGEIPKILRVVLRCQSADLGYAVGDEVDFAGILPSPSAASPTVSEQWSGAIWHNATTISLHFPSAPRIFDRSSSALPGGAVDGTKWLFRVRAWI